MSSLSFFLNDLGTGLSLYGGQPFLVTLEPRAHSAPPLIVHTELELAFCLESQLFYTVEGWIYRLEKHIHFHADWALRLLLAGGRV